MDNKNRTLFRPFGPSIGKTSIPEDLVKKINNYVDELKKLGAEKFSKKIKETSYTLITDTTMRDAHQSLLATRMRTDDIVNIAEYLSLIHI